MAKSIDVADLNIYYGDFLAVEGVTIPIAARSVTAFIGPSGCGKSTFLRSLNRMHEVIRGARVEGKVLIDGQAPGLAHGIDTDANGKGVVTAERLYQLVRQPGAVGTHRFEIRFSDPGVAAYAFTFG